MALLNRLDGRGYQVPEAHRVDGDGTDDFDPDRDEWGKGTYFRYFRYAGISVGVLRRLRDLCGKPPQEVA